IEMGGGAIVQPSCPGPADRGQRPPHGVPMIRVAEACVAAGTRLVADVAHLRADIAIGGVEGEARVEGVVGRFDGGRWAVGAPPEAGDQQKRGEEGEPAKERAPVRRSRWGRPGLAHGGSAAWLLERNRPFSRFYRASRFRASSFVLSAALTS